MDMRVMVAVVLIFGLCLAEALYQRRREMTRQFVHSLRALRLGFTDWNKALEHQVELLSGVNASFEVASRVLVELRG